MLIIALSSELIKIKAEPRLTSKNTKLNLVLEEKINEYWPINVRINNELDIDNAVEGLTEALE